MATVTIQRLRIDDPGTRRALRQAASKSGIHYEQAVGGAIVRRKLPILGMIEDATGVPIRTTSMEKTRGPRSSQSWAVFQWQRGHVGQHDRREKRWPDATVEFLGPGGVFTEVYALEISLQTDLTLVGSGEPRELSAAKAQQLALTSALLAGKYEKASIHYWYLSPWAPSEGFRDRLLTPLRNMKGTGGVAITYFALDHTE